MSESHKAKLKQTTVSGGDVNYYLIEIHDAQGNLIVVVEVEDVIEALDMRFAAGNVFKAVVRLCKLRQDLGKPGSKALYEAEKALYYSKRTLAASIRRVRRSGNDPRATVLARPLSTVIEVDEPKRLEPYRFVIEDMISALLPTPYEAQILRGILHVSMLRTLEGPAMADEIRRAEDTLANAMMVETVERAAAPQA